MEGAITRICRQCGKQFGKADRPKYSLSQWSRAKFCSRQCAGLFSKKKDGFSKGERFRRKRGSLPMGTQEWLDRIRSRTKVAMARPDVQQKIRADRVPLDDEHKAKLSAAMAGKAPQNLMVDGAATAYSNVQRGEYETDRGAMYFRSKWEANYARYLDWLVRQKQIASWEYETECFVFEKIRHGTTRYIPDFKVFNLDGSVEYHEVKGRMDQRSRTKLTRMARYFPQVVLKVIDSVAYRLLSRRLGKVVGFY